MKLSPARLPNAGTVSAPLVLAAASIDGEPPSINMYLANAFLKRIKSLPTQTTVHPSIHRLPLQPGGTLQKPYVLYSLPTIETIIRAFKADDA